MNRNIYHFNASCEMAVGNGTNSFTPPAFIQQFEHELELLPLYLASENDLLLVKRPPSLTFMEKISVLHPSQPTINVMENIKQIISLNDRINTLTPWGWSPIEHNYLANLKPFCSDTFLSQPNANWNIKHRDLYSRKTALAILKNFLVQTKEPNLFLAIDHIPQICTNIEEIELLLKRWNSLVIKAPWSSSGRGMIILKEHRIHSTYIQWINGTILKQGYVMVEPRLNKVYDLSFHYKIQAGKTVIFLGQASFATEEGGQYIGNNIQKLPLNTDAYQNEILNNESFELIQKGLENALKQSPLFEHYHGILGIDVLLYKNNYDKLKFYPCMEINLRQNMGTVALSIRELMHKQAKGMWQIKYFNGNNREQSLEFDNMMKKKNPLLTENNKITKGYMPLIEPYKGRKFALYIDAI